MLREAIDLGDPNLKDRMSIKLENDVRYGEVRLDHWMFFAKVKAIQILSMCWKYWNLNYVPNNILGARLS